MAWWAYAIVSSCGFQQMEQRLKTRVLGKDLHGISAVNPDEYAQRFQEMLTERLQ
eukprot:m.579981 g.579981  ORF g.579981 m.579981 type:complete len:55 (+) comp22319_c0_seq9:2611-2775(+)